MTKQQLRIIFKEKRKSLTLQEIGKFNDLIFNNFKKLELPFINCVHTYLASLKLCEPDTARIIRHLQLKNPFLKIGVPKIDIRSGILMNYYFDKGVEMIQNTFGIEEPKKGDLIPETEIDLILIPMLAFDKKGNRVGFGKGYYDKFLSHCKPAALKIGLSFFEPVDKIEDIITVDIPLDFCVTPKKNYLF